MGRNLSLISINKGIQLMGGALWALIVPRWLGPQAYGQFALAMSLSLLLWWVGDFGGLEVFGRHMPQLIERKPKAASKLFGQAFLLRLLVGLSLPFMMLLLGPLIAPWLAGWPAFLIGLSAGLHIISWTSYHLLYATKQMGKWSVETSWRLTTQLPLVLMAGARGVSAQMAAYTINELIYLGLAFHWTKRWFTREALRPDLRFLRPYLRMGLGFWATNIGLIVLFRSGTLLVQLITGNSVQVSYFDLSLTVFFLVFTIIDQLLRAFLPTVSEFKAGGQHQRAGHWLQTVTQWGAALAVVAVVAVQYTADWIMPFILGSAYEESALVLKVMLLSLPAIVVVGMGTVATAVQESPRHKLIALVAGILTFWLSSAHLAAQMGAVGAAWAMTLGLTVYALVFFAFVRDALHLKWPMLLGLIALGLPFLTAQTLVKDNFLVATAASVAVAFLYFAAALGLRLLSPAPLQLLLRAGKPRGPHPS
ncbi:MAG: hypothetical protein GXP42_07930 [Chloroflexi bacterium]|nr:hypothetical protein [Chloroflexota bacterium]